MITVFIQYGVNDLRNPFKEIKNRYLIQEIKNWKFIYKSEFEELKKYKLNGDVLGVIYQSTKLEGEKSAKGSYYTPNYIVKDCMKNINSQDKVLDPCCGSGQFLLEFSKVVSPENIYGYDIDEMAVKLAKINLMLLFKDKEFNPNIFHKDFLLSSCEMKFDFIATNPPWGAKLTKEQINSCNKLSKESYGLFLYKSLKCLKNGGYLSFVLPHSFLNVKTHNPIRELARKYKILEIKDYKKAFKKVFSDVLRIDIKKESFVNDKFIFNINITDKDKKIINKMDEMKNNFLQADFGLGIVTGDNEKHLKDNPLDKIYEPIYRGKDIEKFFLKSPQKFIKFDRNSFQQVALEEKYRSKKIIYKFISKELILVYDDKGVLTLNSANFFIPQNYDILLILGLFNSKLYNFYFQKKFNSIKVLKSHLENLPIPKLNDTHKSDIKEIVKLILTQKSDQKELDEYIFKFFNLKV